MGRQNAVFSVVHHAEGIVEFHSTSTEPHTIFWTLFSLQRTGVVALMLYAPMYSYMSRCADTRYISYGPTWDFVGLWLLVSLFACWRRRGRVWRESLLVVHDLGLQVRRQYFSGKQDYHFVERGCIQDVIINEGVGFATVTYYLACITSDDSDMILAFRDLIPPLSDLVHVLHCLRSVILGEEVPEWQHSKS